MKKNSRLSVARPDRAPTHPGAILREDVLPAVGEPVMTVAKKLGVTRQRSASHSGRAGAGHA